MRTKPNILLVSPTKFFKKQVAFRVNLAYAKVAGDDQNTKDP